MVVPIPPEAQPHRFVGTVRRETVESSGTSELLFGNIDRFNSYVALVNFWGEKEQKRLQKENVIEKKNNVIEK